MDDLISRQAAIDWLKNEWDGMVTSVFDGIKNLPSAQPERGEYKEGFIDGERWATDIMEQKFRKVLDDEFSKYMNPPEG